MREAEENREVLLTEQDADKKIQLEQEIIEVAKRIKKLILL